MEWVIFRKKLHLLDPISDGELKKALGAIIERKDIKDSLSILRPIFISSYATLCRNEGIESIASTEDEMAIKDRIPDTIANWLTVLSEIFSGKVSVQRVIDPVDTAAILLLKIREWSCLNYEGRFLYGNMLEDMAIERFRAIETEMDLLGDKDEILTLVLDGLKGFCTNYWIVEDSLLPGVRTYFVEIRYDYGRGQKSLMVALKSTAFDQVKLRAYCKDQHILAHIFESLVMLSHVGKQGYDNYI